MYDYVEEMTKDWLNELMEKVDDKPFSYEDISKRLTVVTNMGERQVSGKVRRLFEKLYEQYVEKRVGEVSERNATIIFCEKHNKCVSKYTARGVAYYNDNLLEVIKALPYCREGEYYKFPALRVDIRGRSLTFRVIS